MSAPSGPVRELDLRGLNCPLPVLRTRKALAALPAGARVAVETSDPVSVIDLPHFCREEGHRLIASEPTPHGHRFVIEKGGPS